MSSRPLNVLRSLNVRLALLFSVLFTALALILFVLSYVLLLSTLRREKEQEIRSRMLEFWALYQANGLQLLEEELVSDSLVARRGVYLVRIADGENETIFLSVPGHWREYPVERLETTDPGKRFRLASEDGEGVVEVSSLYLHDGNVIQIGVDITERLETLARYRRIFFVLVLPLVALGFLSGLFFAHRSLSPIQHLIRVIRSILSTGRMNARLQERGVGDELDELVGLFNRMLERIESLINGMRNTVDNVAHDLRTPLARIIGRAQMAVEGATGSPAERSAGECRAVLTDCVEESRRMLKLLETLMDISQAETGVLLLERTATDLAALVEDMAELYRYAAEEKGIALEAETGEALYAEVDPDRIRQVLSNLLDNAVKYTPEGGGITVSAAPSGEAVEVVVRDTGIGILRRDLDHIWDRLYRSDRSRSEPGLGLGLSLVRAIVTAHGGTISVASEPRKGSRFAFRLTRVRSAGPADRPSGGPVG